MPEKLLDCEKFVRQRGNEDRWIHRKMKIS